MADNNYFDSMSAVWEEEGLFARDMNGQLIRAEQATRKDFDERITLTIDGEEITVPKAVPQTDSQGNIIIVDGSGRTIPRRTTIYDAALLLARKKNPQNPRAELNIPTVCHAEHLPPVGVCRVCSVEVARLQADRKDPTKMREVAGEKLVPACVHPVEPGMIIHTHKSPNEKAAGRVGQQVKVLLELLGGDHLPADTKDESELAQLVTKLKPTLGIDTQRLVPLRPLNYKPDFTSSLINVDHNACILCDRCARACTVIKENFVIGRTGKGYSTRIGFDLNDPMGESSCVECGECMLHCPTTALTFRKPIDSDWYREQLKLPGRFEVTPEEMANDRLLRALPYRYRQWNQTSVVRRKVKAGDELCILGEHGNTAFILREGRFGIYLQDPRAGHQGQRAVGVWERIFSGGTVKKIPELGAPNFEVSPADLIIGEMTCMNHYPRTATIRALNDGEVLEIRRNMLYTLQRNPESREVLDSVYRSRALSNHLKRVPFFATLSDAERKAAQDFLTQVDPQTKQPRVKLVRLQPGQTIFRQGESANESQSGFYMVRIGHVKVSQTFGGEERVINYLGPDKNFGELGLLADYEELRDVIPAGLENRRTATCTALDDVELVVIDRDNFRQLVHESKPLRKVIAQQTAAIMQQRQDAAMRPTTPLLEEFTSQGLYNAQRLLVLDLESCTRCDECVKACADVHDGVTRFIRDGLRFDKWLVASACRSCSDPYCLVGCPVDAIHRGGERLEIKIESHCIGCGQCANNCPYGNINMYSEEQKEDYGGKRVAVTRSKATMCDLCHDVPGAEKEVSCVFACPHHAAFRMSGPELLKLVANDHK